MRKPRNITRLFIMTLALVGLMSGVALMPMRLARTQTVGGSWASTGSLNIPRTGHTATLLPNGKVLAVGGINRPFNYTTMNSAELYDPVTGGWSYTGSLGTARYLHAATLLRNGQVLVAGGYDYENVSLLAYLNSAELFDPATGQWRPTGSLHTITGHPYAALLTDGKVLAVGTSTQGVPNRVYSAELYDPATGTWTSTAAPLTLGPDLGSLTPLGNGKVLALCGDSTAVKSAELYDPATRTWSSAGSLNVIRTVRTTTLLHNGNVLVTGLTANSPGAPTAAELYDPNTGTWSVTSYPSITGRATLLSDGRVLLTGDYDAYVSPAPGSGDEVYDPNTGTWSQTSLHNPPRSEYTATMMLDGRVLAAGGADVDFDNGEVIFNNAEVYTPDATPGANTVQFNFSSYTVSEGSPRVDITLARSGDTAAAATVSLATSDAAGLQNCNVTNGIASPRCDYQNTIGTVGFAAGQTSKVFSIAIVDDSYAEGNETFTIGLNNGSGTTLGAQSTATVTINDNDGSNGPNPIASTDFFVRQQYIDFLGREPDPAGFTGWASTINNCAPGDTNCDRIHVSQLFFQSEEFQSRGYFAYRFYPVAFGRKPDYTEFVPDLARVSGFLDASQLEAAKVQFIADFMARPGFVSQYNSLSNTGYVDALINTASVNLPNGQALIDSLNNNSATRAQVLRQIVESIDVSTKYSHQAFAVMEYFGYLRRQPDAFYLNWIQVLDQSNDPRGMVTGFATSAEYRQRFGK